MSYIYGISFFQFCVNYVNHKSKALKKRPDSTLGMVSVKYNEKERKVESNNTSIIELVFVSVNSKSHHILYTFASYSQTMHFLYRP